VVAIAAGQESEGRRVLVQDGATAQVTIEVKGKAKRMELPTIELGLGETPREALASR
jgi:hypothetical protein